MKLTLSMHSFRGVNCPLKSVNIPRHRLKCSRNLNIVYSTTYVINTLFPLLQLSIKISKNSSLSVQLLQKLEYCKKNNFRYQYTVPVASIIHKDQQTFLFIGFNASETWILIRETYVINAQFPFLQLSIKIGNISPV